MDDKNNGFPGKSGQNGDKDKRPRVTLDLKATEIPDPAAARQALPPPSDDASANGRVGTRRPGDSSLTGWMSGAALLVSHIAAGLAGGLIALVLAFYGVEHFRDRMTALSGATAEAIKGEMSAIEAKLAALEKAAGNESGEAAAATAQFDALTQDAKRISASLAALDSRVTKIERAPRSEPVQGDGSEDSFKPLLASLEAKVAALEAKLSSLAAAQNDQKISASATALAVAFNDLRRAVFSGKPFASELDVVTQLDGGQDAAALSPYQETGIASLEALAKDFAPLARSALAAEYANEDSSFITRLWGEARSMIRIRRTGMVEGDTVEAILARTETRLKAGDLAAAVKEASALKGEAAVIFRPWLDAAKARVAAEAALDRMEAKLLAALKNKGAGR